MRELILGGTRSGKSAMAEALASSTGAAVRYIATAPDYPDDEAWQRRLRRHRQRRPSSWTTVEGTDLVAALGVEFVGITVVDDLGTWVTSALDARNGWTDPQVTLHAEVAALANAVRHYRHDLIIVSPEVGLSVVPATAAGRTFQDELGAANIAVAAECSGVQLVIAGIPMIVKS